MTDEVRDVIALALRRYRFDLERWITEKVGRGEPLLNLREELELVKKALKEVER